MAKHYQIAHDTAVKQKMKTYEDPDTGNLVFTEFGLKQKGRCCGCGCRHCPFQHQKIPMAARISRIQNPAWLTNPQPGSTHVLFWSGGKDSFLALRAMTNTLPKASITLLATFDATTRVVAHQEVALKEIVDQALELNLPLIGVPLNSGDDYISKVEAGLALMDEIDVLAFGNLHLEHIKNWNEQAFAPFLSRSGASIHFPLWCTDYKVLLHDLVKSGAECTISAATHPLISHLVGQRFDNVFIEGLPDEIDQFGEYGEFYTRISSNHLRKHK